MTISKEDKEYLIQMRIKSLNGKKNMISQGEPVEESIQDIEAKIEVLTNTLKMI